MKRICLDCDHPCHCIGQGFHTQDTYCYVTGCVCTDCNHTVKEVVTKNKEEPMARKIWEWVCWPFKKVWDWLKSCLPNG
jgi:hypothetical protein